MHVVVDKYTLINTEYYSICLSARLSECMYVCVWVGVCVLPWWYVDLQDPGFELLVQHDVKAEQLVAAIRCLKVHLQQAVNVRFGADDQHTGERSFHNRYYFPISKQKQIFLVILHYSSAFLRFFSLYLILYTQREKKTCECDHKDCTFIQADC